jgi:putative ABC transport system substrate-binding protein
VDYRGAEGRPERLAAVSAELSRVPVDVIVAPGTAEALAARKATTSIPVVMTGVDDPVGRGLVESLARPRGNVTGLATARGELSGKLLSLLREMLPGLANVAMLWDSKDADHHLAAGHLQIAAKTLGLTLISAQVKHHTEIESAVATVRRQGAQALLVPPSDMLVPRWIADLATRHALPLASTAPAYAYEGALMAYAADWNAVFAQVAAFVDRILRGEKPGDLPVELPSKFRLIVNVRTARTLGLAVPQSILLRADNIVE